MTGRLADKKAIVVGAGQTPGETIGNGRAMAMLFARQGADVLCVDRNPSRAQETVDMITAEGGRAWAFGADIVSPEESAAIVSEGRARFGRIDVLVNNVGIGSSEKGGDGPAHLAGPLDGLARPGLSFGQQRSFRRTHAGRIARVADQLR